jgi:hypothetical protein
MGVDFMGHGGASLNWSAWRSCCAIAKAFGWRPAGTLAPTFYGPYEVPEDFEWKGDYFSNAWQKVTDDDARAFGLALQNALTALRSGQELTKEQREALGNTPVSVVSELSDYALTGGFLIG